MGAGGWGTGNLGAVPDGSTEAGKKFKSRLYSASRRSRTVEAQVSGFMEAVAKQLLGHAFLSASVGGRPWSAFLWRFSYAQGFADRNNGDNLECFYGYRESVPHTLGVCRQTSQENTPLIFFVKLVSFSRCSS